MLFSQDIGIDLGTSNTIVFVKGKGIIIREPSVVAMDQRFNPARVVAVGSKAKEMIGRTPGSVSALHPIQSGVVADFDATAEMLRRYIKKATNNSPFNRTRVMVCVPSGVTEFERRAVNDAVKSAGAKYIIGYKADNLQSGAVAGAISNKIMGSVVAGVTEDKVVAVPENASIFTLGGSTGAWTLHTDDGYVEPTAEKNLAYKETASASNSWNISVANNGVASITWSNSSYGSLYYNTSNPRFTTYKNAQASVRLYRVYETPVAPQFRIKVGVTAAIADLATTDGVTECGVAVTAGNTTQRFALSGLHTDDTGIRYATIDLGDIVNNYSRATTAFMVRAYVKSGEDYIYTTDAGKYKNLSVRDMVNVYHGMNEYKDLVDGLWSFFNAVSAY